MKTGVMGGDADRVQSPPARISENTSSSQPILTPSRPSPWKNVLFTGVGRNSQLDGGLLMALPDDDNGGVAGANRMSEKSVSNGCRYGESCWMRIVGFWYMGCGDATGVMSDWGT
jgi:hypothetical protein